MKRFAPSPRGILQGQHACGAGRRGAILCGDDDVFFRCCGLRGRKKGGGHCKMLLNGHPNTS